MRTIIISLLLLSIFALFACGCSLFRDEDGGILTGKVSVGPLTPVERPGQTQTVPPEIYKNRFINIYNETLSVLIRQVPVEPDGSYRITLRSGLYVVNVNAMGIEHARNLPKMVEIKVGETTTLNIDIDTGIR